MSNQETVIRCSDCLTIIKASDNKCPNCGSYNRKINTAENEITDEYTMNKQWYLDRKHKNNRANYEYEVGYVVGSDGSRVHKKLVIDRDHASNDDSYQENVVNSETGQVVVDKHEKLSEHHNKKSK